MIFIETMTNVKVEGVKGTLEGYSIQSNAQSVIKPKGRVQNVTMHVRIRGSVSKYKSILVVLVREG